MDSILEKSSDRSRSLLFGLLVNCIISKSIERSCPLSKLRNSLSIEKKHAYVMGLSEEEVKRILVQHDECYQKELADFLRE